MRNEELEQRDKRLSCNSCAGPPAELREGTYNLW